MINWAKGQFFETSFLLYPNLKLGVSRFLYIYQALSCGMIKTCTHDRAFTIYAGKRLVFYKNVVILFLQFNKKPTFERS